MPDACHDSQQLIKVLLANWLGDIDELRGILAPPDRVPSPKSDRRLWTLLVVDCRVSARRANGDIAACRYQISPGLRDERPVTT